MRLPTTARPLLVVSVLLSSLLAGGAVRTVQDVCGPFSDVSPAFCPYVLEMYYLGITAGTSMTTFSPDATLTRGQAAVFVSKGANQAIARSSRRAALGQWWTPSQRAWDAGLGVTPLLGGLGPFGPVACDGQDVWVGGQDRVFRVRASDGKLLETWTIAKPAAAVLVAMGRVFVAEFDLSNPSTLSMIDPSQPPGPATVVATGLPSVPLALAFDGTQIWTTDPAGSVSIITPSSTLPWPVTVVSGFQSPYGIVFDGANIWISDGPVDGSCSLRKLDSSAAVLQSVDLGSECQISQLAFDGSNVLAPNKAVGGLQVVRVSDGSLIATIPVSSGQLERVAFDGERVLVLSGGGQNPPPNLAILQASNFSTVQVEFTLPIGGRSWLSAASDGVNFWITTGNAGESVLARY